MVSVITVGTLTRSVLRRSRDVTILTVVRHRHDLSPTTRLSLARLSWCATARHGAAEQSFHWFVRMHRRAGRHPTKAAARQATVATLCRRTYGISPALRLVIGITTPLSTPRLVIRDCARHAITELSGLTGPALRTAHRRLRIVFKTVFRVQDLLRSDYRHAAGYVVGKARPCC